MRFSFRGRMGYRSVHIWEAYISKLCVRRDTTIYIMRICVEHLHSGKADNVYLVNKLNIFVLLLSIKELILTEEKENGGYLCDSGFGKHLSQCFLCKRASLFEMY